jgi:alanine dehydrogenase
MASQDVISHEVQNADLVIGSVLIPGAKTPKLIDRELLRSMVPGSVLVDVAIDQGGTFETSRPTTHDSPTYLEEDIVHYCVTNMPGDVALTSTLALNNVTLPYVELLATAGIKEAFKKVQGFASGLNTDNGNIVHSAIAAEYDA